MQAEGRYQVCVETLVYGLSGAKGTEQMEIRFYVDENTRRSTFLYFTEKTEDQSMEILAGLGWDGDTKSPAIDDKYYADYVLELECEHEEYNGNMKERWRIPGGGKAAPDDIASRRAAAFRARFGNKKPTPAGAPKAPPPATTKKAPPPPPAETVYGKDEAWGSVVDICGDAGVNTQTWTNVVSAFGKPEGDFTADDWKKVVSDYAAAEEIPF